MIRIRVSKPRLLFNMLSIIVAISQNHVIGKDNQLPWHLSEDLKHFKKTTMGHPIIMGRKTFESIGKPLPGRENVVITRNANYAPKGVTVLHDLSKLKDWQTSDKEYFIIGGSEIYKLCLPYVNTLYLTKILKDYEGHAHFPEIDFEHEFQVVEESAKFTSEKNGLPYQFIKAQRTL